MIRLSRIPRALFGLIALVLVLGPTHLKGALQTNSGSGDRRPLAWRTEIQYLQPDRTPFLQVLGKIKSRPVDDPEFKVFERDVPSRWTRLNEALDTSETGVDVDDGSMFRVDDVVLIPSTNERVLVTAISGNTLTVTRGIQGTSGTAADDNAWVKILYSKEEENGVSAESISTDYTTVTNFTQIFKRSYSESRTSKQTKRRGPANLTEERRIAMGLIKEDMEQACLWGRKREENGSGSTVRYTGGLDQFISTNRIDAEGGIGYGDIGYFMNVATRFGGSRKIWLCGRDARQQIDSLGLTYLQVDQNTKKMGMSVSGFQTSFGEVLLVTHLGLDNAHAGHIFVIDPEHCALAELQELTHERDLQENDRDGEKHQFLAEVGLWMDTEKAHMVITGVTARIV
jgi:hypothetical protein